MTAGRAAQGDVDDIKEADKDAEVAKEAASARLNAAGYATTGLEVE